MEFIKQHGLKYISRNAFHPISFGVFRIALGIAILFHFLVYLYPGISLIYFNDGILNYETYRALTYGIGYSIFDFPLPHSIVQLLFIITFALIILFIIGYKSRIISILLLFMLFNIFQRGIISGGGEKMYAICLLSISVFLPLNSACTFKSFKQSYTYNKNTYLLICTALIIQCGLIYCSTGLLKVDPTWTDGTLLSIVSSDPLNGYPYFSGKPLLWTKPICILIPFIELIIGLSILINPRNIKAKMAVGIGLIGLHLGIISLLMLFHMCIYGLAIATLFFPFQKWIKSPSREIIYKTKEKSKYPKLIIFYILLISWVNFQPIATKGKIKSFFEVTYLNKVIKKINIPVLSASFPLNQNWALVAKLPEKFGCIEFIGEDELGITYNLITQEKQTGECCSNKNFSQKEFLEIIRIIYFSSDSKNYNHIYEKLTNSFLLNWETKFPERKIVESEVLFHTLDGKNRKTKKLLHFNALEISD